ncbi:acidocalcisomal exopolyphosphatase [Trypanosoma equiperdum]|uniref:Acidocalcisomal exopolyphosphatase, putative n=4 Tax=Trypanozoon TaxID=39700 RepID=Q38FJ8_TRYB2|nr:acidocalcisomal exopolyphosphatase, putative [Trypanosoma brucei gambiense DAL972]XP_803633.1 acidocalcisomal exopolyphosphatase, putative [Trypanosoma brucei brucei TREU927]AAP74699.1 acidocalcisomal exopolyphosphatase [Trypanosoma brucei]SCU69832.1 acidocalcisomal exopolyphosphatase [Trypanosoma equiperdum]EAN76422.1 acidocalcisomal exopolyphosphatase, putative [Trypanosoma brucei brucei TREU927]CBH14088.1 acidocalcisomal exopolyphosphatase, putative [Trypanosoma brucei gambiense DAL972]|eukprot:XP_011776359.1 acidocalcisomal exopolyphosphatase, putative [Trypanosoma brucei gambiense DAL972]
MTAVVNEFLKRGVRALAARQDSVLVMGNEGGDMDTVIGSIFLAMYLEKRDVFGVGSYVPVLNFEKDDLPLRQDVVKLLSRHNVSTDSIYSVKQSGNGVDFLDLHQMKLPIVLYDHNKLSPEQVYLGERIVGVVDHHEDEQLYVDQTKCLRRICKTGSACTLVAELFNEAGLEVPCPELLLAPIVVDTVNFEPSQKRVTERDILASRLLVGRDDCGDYLTGMFKELMAWKNDIHCLTVPQHLRRDYKNFEFPFISAENKILRVGISSISCRSDELLSVHGVSSVSSNCIEFIKQRSIDMLLLTFAGERTPGSYCRQLGVVAKDEGLAALQAYCKKSPSGLDFTLLEDVTVNEWAFSIYELSDPSVSRKKLVPSLTSFLSVWNNL